MLIKLPIIINNKISIINFKLSTINNKIFIEPYNDKKNNLYQIFITNQEFCMVKFYIKFPFELEIIKLNTNSGSNNSSSNKSFLFCNLFFVLALYDNFDCELNFFTNLLKEINKIACSSKKKGSYSQNDMYKNLRYMNMNLLKKHQNYLFNKILFDKNKLDDDRKHFKDFKDMELYFDSKLSYYLNLTYMLLYLFPLETSKQLKEKYNIITKKIIKNYNLIKIKKKKFKTSENLNIINHLENFINKNFIEKNVKVGKKYFIKLSENKIINFTPNLNENNFLSDGLRKIKVNDYDFYIYNPQFESFFTKDYLIKEIIKDDCENRLFFSSKIFKLDEKSLSSILKYIYEDKENFINLSFLKNLKFKFDELELSHYNDKNKNLEIEILKDGLIDNNYIKYLSDIYKDDYEKKIDILKILFEKYNFPLSFNKKKLNEYFEMIIYFSFLNYEDFVRILDNKLYLNSDVVECIPIKLKNLYFNLLKIFYQFKNNSLENITFNFKFYQDYIYIYVLKNIIQNNTIITSTFDNIELFTKLINLYQKNNILFQLISEINWTNLSKKLPYLDYVYKNNDVIFYQNKLNRNLFPDDYDFKIKNIILDPFLMYKYLKKDKDFVKWTKFLKGKIIDLYEKPISISEKDLESLGCLLYKLMNLNDQDLKNPQYMDLISFCQKNKKLILSQNRINLKIRDKLPSLKCPLNLGFFAKHLNHNCIDKIEIVKNDDVDKLEIKLKITKKKYYKYKGKYLKTKTSSTSSLTNFT